MLNRDDFKEIVTVALHRLGGRGTIVEVAKEIWRAHEAEIRASGDILYTWQYEVRWAASKLRDDGKIAPVARSPKGIWELASP